ncbi:sterile alpha motif domain-containing protein 9-like [Carassius gibelio]|uniref:sterile alpha motif domain-containing protein 9-like n=1 Tax=Carassius gibelio TaxID=101364 RepID=UPI002279008B|nr:sterile alpha motif domain-containing protein 9-like [Carassius gibelio]
MQVLWHFRKDLRCAKVIDSDLDTKELSKQVLDLFLLSNEQHAKQDWKTVLLLLDIKEYTNDDMLVKRTLRKNLNEEIRERGINTDTPVVIIFNCSPADFPTNVRSTDDVELTMKLSPEERKRFDQKKKELKKKYNNMSQKFHAFNIMQGGFKKDDAEKLITAEMVEHIEKDTKSSSTRLLSFLALINSYVPGSHLLKLFCEDFISRSKQPTDEEIPKLETIMKPFEGLIITYSEGEQEDQCICLAHPMIADACLKILTEHKLTRYDIALDFLNSMVKEKESKYEKMCKKIFITRLETGQGKDKFSRLILDIIKDTDANQCIPLLEFALELFSTDPHYPQIIARLYCIMVKEDNKYEKAENWAKQAIKRDPKKSDIKDTLGQVHKHHLRNQFKRQSLDIEVCLGITKSAIEAFEDEEEAAEVESEDNTRFNNSGSFGFLQVCSVFHEMHQKNPHKQQHSDFINDLRCKVESRYDFFEWYLAFSRLSLNKEDPDYFHEDVDECYWKYFKQREQTDEATLNEKKMKSFGGLLHFLKSDINVLKQYKSTFDNTQSDNETQTVLYILANIILSQSGDPCEKAEDLQARLQRLWLREMQDRSPEFYLLILLLFWADEAPPGITNPPNLEMCVQETVNSYKRKYQKYLRGRYLVPLFFFRKGKGLRRLVHISKLNQMDLELLTEGDEHAEVECLQRINGEVKNDMETDNDRVFAVKDGQQIKLTPHNPSSVCKPGQVSFYLGFTIRGPVAFNIRYEEKSKEPNEYSEYVQTLNVCLSYAYNEEDRMSRHAKDLQKKHYDTKPKATCSNLKQPGILVYVVHPEDGDRERVIQQNLLSQCMFFPLSSKYLAVEEPDMEEVSGMDSSVSEEDEEVVVYESCLEVGRPIRRELGVTGSISAISEETYPNGLEFNMPSTSTSTVISTSSGTDCEPREVRSAVLRDLTSLSHDPMMVGLDGNGSTE